MCKKINSRLASKFSKQKLPSVKTVHFLLVFDFHLGAVRINTRAPAYILKARILTPTILTAVKNNALAELMNRASKIHGKNLS